MTQVPILATKSLSGQAAIEQFRYSKGPEFKTRQVKQREAKAPDN